MFNTKTIPCSSISRRYSVVQRVDFELFFFDDLGTEVGGEADGFA